MSGCFQDLGGLTLLAPAWLWLFLPLPLLLLWRLLARHVSVAMPASMLLRPQAGQPRMPRSLRQRLLWLPSFFLVLAYACGVLAMARPVTRQALPLESRGIDLMLCIDSSSSMAEKDMDPERTRLDLAKSAAERLIAGRPQDRIGILSFARDPLLRCPPSSDHAAVVELLHGIELVDKNSEEDQTGIGAAVARAIEVVKDAESKAVLLLTDGAENVASADTPEEIGPIQAAWFAEKLGVRVYVVRAGLGRPGPQGRMLPRDSGQVAELARRSGGALFAARDAAAIERVYRRIDQIESVEFEEQRYVVRERFDCFALLASMLLVLGAALQRSCLGLLS
ncbi:MAG: hypothetical protein CSA62_11750 [Planctomycetota bacterium]|nr:MAG: hypothetical protein CSA62_11750 [Planctomycetota bacterium]